MAANDYHVIMYQILLYLYDCLKKGIDPDSEAIDGYRRANGISIRYWNRVIVDMQNDGYIENADVIAVAREHGKGTAITIDTEITRKGIEYLVEAGL